MSDLITPDALDEALIEDETPVEPTEVTLDDAFQAIEDGSHLAEGFTKEGLVEAITKAATLVKSAFVRVTNSYKGCAHEIARAYRVTLLPTGQPDWAGDSATSQAILSFSLDKVLAALQGDRKRVRQAIMAHLNRTYLDLEIRDYVASMTALDGSKMYPDGPAFLNEDEPDAFKLAVRRQYLDAGLAVPSKYQSPEDKQAQQNGGGGPGQGPGSPMTAVRKGIEGLSAITARWAALALLEGLSTFVQRIEAGEAKFGSSDEKKAVGEILYRCANVALYGAKAVDGEVKPHDRDTVLASYFDADTDEKDA